MMGKVIIGKVVGQFKNCACGKVQEGFCKECKTEALSIIGIQEIESEDEVEMDEFLDVNKNYLAKKQEETRV